MATKDGISVNSNDSSGRSDIQNENVNNNEIDDDISTITLITDNKFSSICMYYYLCDLIRYTLRTPDLNSSFIVLFFSFKFSVKHNYSAVRHSMLLCIRIECK